MKKKKRGSNLAPASAACLRKLNISRLVLRKGLLSEEQKVMLKACLEESRRGLYNRRKVRI